MTARRQNSTDYVFTVHVPSALLRRRGPRGAIIVTRADCTVDITLTALCIEVVATEACRSRRGVVRKLGGGLVARVMRLRGQTKERTQ